MPEAQSGYCIVQVSPRVWYVAKEMWVEHLTGTPVLRVLPKKYRNWEDACTAVRKMMSQGK